MRQHVRRWASAPRVGAVGAAMVFGGAMGLRAAPPDYDFDWVTVGAPGNRSANEQEAPLLYPPYEQQPILVGAVPYTYRISKTELTVKQWYEFVQAYAPYYTGSRNSSAFTSLWIYANDQNPDHPPDFRIVSGAENHPADMSWRFAARYCNWLENGKALNKEAFEQGVYDTRTFGSNADHSFTDNVQHAPGARYWIPSLDEWTKAAYYDPDRYGPGQGGYWKQPGGQNAPLTPGYPWEGGQSNAGIPYLPESVWLDVGSYPNVNAPWGILDTSGGVSEWTSTDVYGDHYRLAGKGAGQFYPLPGYWDALDYLIGGDPSSGGGGLRLASAVPGPDTFLAVLILSGIGIMNCRGRPAHEHHYRPVLAFELCR